MKTNQAIFDVLEVLGQNTVDGTVTERLALQWLNRARSEKLAAYIKENGEDNLQKWAKVYECVGLEKLSHKLYDAFLVLPEVPLDVMGDMGVISVQREGGNTIDPIDGGLNGLVIQSKTMFGTGSSEYFYRIGDTIYLKGAFPVNAKLTVVMIPQGLDDWDDEDVYPAPDELMNEIIIEAEEIGRRYLQIPKDVKTDGKGREEEV